MSSSSVSLSLESPAHVVLADKESGSVSVIYESGSAWSSQAVAAASQALDHLNAFRGVYYGAYSSNPALDPNGDAPDVGDLYFNTGSGLRVFDGTSWTAYSPNTNPIPSTSGNRGKSLVVNNAEDDVEFAFPSRLSTVLASASFSLDDAFTLGEGAWSHVLHGGVSGAPSGVVTYLGSFCHTVNHGDAGHQVLYQVSPSLEVAPKMWMRVRSSGTTGPWTRVGSASEFELEAFSGNLDDLAGSVTGQFVRRLSGPVVNGPAVAPVGSVVDTYVLGPNGAIQRLIAFGGGAAGVVMTFERVKKSGSWGLWRQTSGSSWMPAVASDGVIYDASVDGSVSQVVTPDFEDGFEYKVVIEDVVTPTNTGLVASFMFQGTGSWSPWMTVTSSSTSGLVHNADVFVPTPRRLRRSHAMMPVSIRNDLPGNNTGNIIPRWTGNGAGTPDVVSKMRFAWTSGALDTGRIVLMRRPDGR